MLNSALEQTCGPAFCSGLKAAIVTDRDGVVILKSIAKDAPATVTEPSIPTAFSVANSQASKLGLKRNQCIVSMYDRFQVVQIDHSPLIITLVGDADANTGSFMNLGKEIATLTQGLVDALKEA